jgi:hypothetical protein
LQEFNGKGKSTIFKQISVEFEGKDFTKENNANFNRMCINILCEMTLIFEELSKVNWQSKFKEEDQSMIQEIVELPKSQFNNSLNYALKLSSFLNKMMKDEQFKEIVDHHHFYNLSDCILHQFSNFESIVNKQGMLTKQDYLR